MVQRYNENYFTLRKALDIESNGCTAGSQVSAKPEWLLVYIKLS